MDQNDFKNVATIHYKIVTGNNNLVDGKNALYVCAPVQYLKT